EQQDTPLPLDNGVLVPIAVRSQGRFSDITQARWQRPNQSLIDVAVKKLVQRVDDPKGLTTAEARERSYREGERWARMWNNIKHRRILPVLAFARTPPPYVVSPWCEYGDLKSYLRLNPSLDMTVKLESLVQVGEAILALHAHRPPVIHGNIHSTNVLVHAPGQIYLAGFSQARYLDEPNQHTSSGLTTGADEFSPSYIVPEVTKELPLAPATDAYSYACLILECLSGNPPYYNMPRSIAVFKILLKNDRPSPDDHPELQASDPLWPILHKAWNIEISERPTVADIVAALRARVGNNTRRTPVTRPPSIEASPALADSTSFSLSSSGIQPGTSISEIDQLEGKILVSDHSPMFRGGFGDVYRGEWVTPNGQKQTVAVKYLRNVSFNPDETDHADTLMENRLALRVRREASIWSELSKLRHPYIVPFFGFKLEARPILVSKWYENGSLGDYVKAHPTLTLVQRLDFLSQTAQALAYLHNHSPPISHGDVKPNNVLLDENITVGLADFGLSHLVDDTSKMLETGIGTKGYQAPELVQGLPNTLASDVYAFGSFSLSILSGDAPFYELNLQQTLIAVNEGAIPSRKSHPLLSEDNPVWILLEHCWQANPTERPAMGYVVRSLQELRTSQLFAT
ncbi:hypothetical protein FRC05_008328, partial [Tulasnella sp. 425]